MLSIMRATATQGKFNATHAVMSPACRRHRRRRKRHAHLQHAGR